MEENQNNRGEIWVIKPYYKHEHDATIVEVEDFGVINLSKLPIEIHLEDEGHYEINWIRQKKDGEHVYVLAEHGGKSRFDYGGRSLGVKNKIE